MTTDHIKYYKYDFIMKNHVYFYQNDIVQKIVEIDNLADFVYYNSKDVEEKGNSIIYQDSHEKIVESEPD